MNFREAFDDGDVSGIRTIASLGAVPPAAYTDDETAWEVDPYPIRFATREQAEAFIRATGRTDIVATETT